MSDSQVEDFIAYLNSTAELREQVERLERSIAYALRREDEAIAAIAVEAGFDVSRWNGRAVATEPAVSEASGLCCGIMTAAMAAVARTLDS